MKFGFMWLGLAFSFLAFSFPEQKKDSSFVLRFSHHFGDEILEPEKEYTTVHGEKVRFTLLNYFISNIKLIQEDGSVYTVPQDSSYFLIRETVPASKEIELGHIPEGRYAGITFMIGVDSLRNTKDISQRTGNLDIGGTAKGMYWVWNSGYIFFKLEGTSPAAPEKQKFVFNYHIGGFGGYRSPTFNNIREKTFRFEPVTVSPKKTPLAEIHVALDHFFDDLRISEKSSVMWGDYTTKIASNYAAIYRLDRVSYQKK